MRASNNRWMCVSGIVWARIWRLASEWLKRVKTSRAASARDGGFGGGVVGCCPAIWTDTKGETASVGSIRYDATSSNTRFDRVAEYDDEGARGIKGARLTRVYRVSLRIWSRSDKERASEAGAGRPLTWRMVHVRSMTWTSLP